MRPRILAALVAATAAAASVVHADHSTDNYYDYYNQHQKNEARAGIGSGVAIDGATVYTGVFDPNNIMIHVAQNMVQ